MTAQPLAQGLADYGRNGDSMLVHMQPREVAGLQALAMAHGGSLTFNPDTGLPEANFLGDVLGAVAPIAVGGLLSMTGLSPLAAGLLTGAATWAATGDPLKGIMGGFGAYGGYGLGKDLMSFGSVAKPATTSLMGSAANIGSDIIKTPGLDAIAGATGTASSGLASVADDALSAVSKTPWENLAAGTEKAISSPMDFLKQSSQGWKNAATVASPFLTAGMNAPMQYAMPGMPKEDVYEGPYLPAKREMRMPTSEETAQLRAAGSPEFNYFTPSNPVPGYQAFNGGGSIEQGGIRDLYGKPDDQLGGTMLSKDGYGLGRLQSMYGSGGTPGLADGGMVPQIGVQPQQPGIPSMAQNANMGDAGLKSLLDNAIRDPMGRTQGMAKGGYLDGPGDGMSDSIPATIEGKHPARLADGEFVIPADVVSHLGNGSTKAGAKVLYGMLDKVRKARTGTKKQGRQINPRKYMPA